MSDLLLAFILIVGGAGWSFICFMALANHPTPSQSDFGIIVYAGPIAFLIGLIWPGSIVIGWLL